MSLFKYHSLMQIYFDTIIAIWINYTAISVHHNHSLASHTIKLTEIRNKTSFESVCRIYLDLVFVVEESSTSVYMHWFTHLKPSKLYKPWGTLTFNIISLIWSINANVINFQAFTIRIRTTQVACVPFTSVQPFTSHINNPKGGHF